MTLYSFISSGLSYVFTTIIYLFIFSVIRLIYLDVRKMSSDDKLSEYEDREMTQSHAGNLSSQHFNTAALHTVKNKEAVELRLKKQYIIEEFAVFGRGEDCEIQVNDKFLSLEHFQIWFEDGEWFLLDMKSRNGTYVNDIRVKKTVILNDGDEISAGGLEFVFESYS